MNPNKNIQMQEEGSGGIIIDVFPRTKSTIVETDYGTLDKVLHDLYFNGSSSGGGIAPGEDAHVRNIYVDGSILPNGADKVIGDKNNRFKAIYVDEVFMSTNTLYIGDTPILGTNQDTIQIKADPNQSINMMTSGAGVTKVLSESGVEFSTSGMNANVVIQAKGVNSQTNIAATSEVNFNAPTLNFNGESRVDNLTVRGNLNVLGSTVNVDAEQVRVKDNMIEINKGEPGSGVTAGTAGLRVDRGDAPSYNILFDEADDLFKVGMDNQLETIASREWVRANSTNYVHPATHPASMITGLAPVATSGNYNDLTNKPTSFPPASHNHDSLYLKLTGGSIRGQVTLNTNTNATPLIISRTGGLTEATKVGIDDGATIFEYTNDEFASKFKWVLKNTDTESSDGSRASTHTLEFGGSNTDKYLQLNGNKFYHQGFKPTPAEIGASPSNHDHNGLYYTKSENNNMFFKRRGAIAGDTDWNTVREPGVYKVQMASWVSGKNAPEMGLYSYGLLEVLISSVESEGRVLQVYHPHRENQPRAFRMCNSEGWQPWQKWHVEASADARYQPKESTKFTMQSANGYVAVRTEGRKAGNHYEFWDNGPGWADIKAGELYANGNRVYHPGNKPAASDIGAAPSSHDHDSLYFRKGNWNTNGGQDLLVHGKRALVGTTNGQLHLGYGGDFTDIRCGNSQRIYHEGFKPTPAEIGAAKGWLSNGATLHNEPVAVFNDNRSSCVGMLKILLPKSWSNTMLSFDLINYDYSGRGKTVFHISGYNYTGDGGQWSNAQFSVDGSPRSDLVRFGYDTNAGKCCILLGITTTEWSYPKFAINNLLVGHSNWDNWERGWSMSIVNSESGLSNIRTGNNTTGGGISSVNRAATVGESTIIIKPERSNEVNFGGSFKDNPYMFFGYRDTDGRPAPSVFVFGKDINGTADVKAKEFYASGNKVYHAGNKPTASDIGALSRSGGTLNGQLVLPNGPDNGLKIGETIFDTVSPRDLVIRNVNQIRFSDSTDWNWNQWGGIKFASSEKTLYIGGPAGDAFNSNEHPPTISINLKSGVDRVDVPSLVTEGDLRIVKERRYDTSLSANNTSQIGIQSNNNGMGIGVDGEFNSRKGWIQVGHADNAYSTYYGTLQLNPKGGPVTIGDSISLSGRDIAINGKRALVGFGNSDGDRLHVNYNGDFSNGVEVRAPLEVLGGGGITKFKALSGDHMYLEFYPNSANLSERHCWMGYGSQGDRQFSIIAEKGGKIRLGPGIHATDESHFSNSNGWFTDPWPNQGCAIKGHGNIACNDRVKAWNGFINGTYAATPHVFMALPQGVTMRNSATMIDSDDIIENIKGIQVYQHIQNTIGKEGQSVPTTVAYAIDANTLPIQVVDCNGDGDDNKINHSSLEAMLAESCKFSINKIEELAEGFRVLAERLMTAEEKIKELEGKLNGNTSN